MIANRTLLFCPPAVECTGLHHAILWHNDFKQRHISDTIARLRVARRKPTGPVGATPNR